MATLVAPYNTAMQLGSGFNSFTQQLCIDHAVKGSVAQEVSYKCTVVDKVTDVTNAMNINAAFAIKYDSFDAKGKGDFINTSKVKESDISFLISVKVVNQVIYDHGLTDFNPIGDSKEFKNFVEIYGDSFISGFQEGGEFTAVISIKARNSEQARKIKANAAIDFTRKKVQAEAAVSEGDAELETVAPGKEDKKAKSDLSAKIDGDLDKNFEELLNNNETTIAVTWSGGGHDLKKPDEDWTLDTMRAAALRFPDLVAKTPMRTHALLTKYSALRSYYEKTLGVTKTLIPNYESAGVYTQLMEEAYLEYKTIAKNLQVLSFDVSSETATLEEAKHVTTAKADSYFSKPQSIPEKEKSNESDSDSVIALDLPGKSNRNTAPATNVPFRITRPYQPTLAGLESARQDVRTMLNRIVAEVDCLARSPDIALDEGRQLPYMAPLLFKEMLPVGRPVAIDNGEALTHSEIAQDDHGQVGEDIAADLTAMTNRPGSKIRF